MSFVDFKEITAINPGTDIRYGGDDLKELMQILNGKIVAGKRPKIANEWLWLSYQDLTAITEPDAPTAGTIRLFPDSTDGQKLKYKKFDNTIVDLTAALPSTFQVQTEGNVVQTRLAAAGNVEILYQWLLSDVSTNSGHLYLWNIDPTDGEFSPLFEGLTNSASPGLQIDPRCTPAGDIGSTALFKISVSRGDLSDIVTRPLFSIGQRSSPDMFVMNVNGVILQTVRAQAGGAETLYRWKVSDGGLSQVELRNASSTDGQFAPWIRVYNYIANASHPGLYLYSHVDAAQDAGSQPVLVFDSRKTDATAITTRPLFDFRTAGTSVFKINPTTFDFTNKTLTNAIIGTTVTGIINANIAAAAAIAYSKLVLTDSIVDADIAASGITTRSKLPSPTAYEDEANTFTGLQTINKTAEAGAEDIFIAKVSDDATGYFKIHNQSTAPSVFRPRISMLAPDNGAIRIVGYTVPGNDTGSLPIISFDSARTGDASITTRPLFAIRNNITDAFLIKADGSMTLKDAANIETGITSGTKIGTAITQKLGFFNATPVTQRAAIASPAADATELKTAVDAMRQVLVDLGFTA